jgi:signal transduction histidine kinase
VFYIKRFHLVNSRERADMQTSTTLLTKPLHLWLARMITLGIILTSIGIGVSRLPEILDKLKHEGVVLDVIWWPDQNGEAIINRLSPTAKQNGVAIGDKLLNYEDDTRGEIGTPVTLYIQRGNSPARDITFLRGPKSRVVFGGTQLGLPFDASVTLAFLFTLIPLVVGAVGALLLYWLRSNDWMALFTAMLLANFGTAAGSEFPPSNPVILIFNNFMFFLTSFWILVFPNGKLMPRWSWAILLLLPPSFVLQGAINLDLLDRRAVAFQGIFTPLTYTAVLALFSLLYFRYSNTFSAVERQQTKWVITPVIAGLMITGITYSAHGYAQTYDGIAIAYFFNFFVRTVFFVALAVAIFFSILRYRLWDIDIIINRALVYGGLSAIVIGIYVLIVGGLGTAIQGRNNLLISILATGLVAVLVQPLRDRLQRGVNRMMYGERDDPVTVLSRLGQRLEGTLAPDAVLPSLIETVAQTLKLPYVAIETRTDSSAASTSSPTLAYGKPQPDVIRLPLIYQSETIGQLLVASRAPGEALNPMDRHLLENIAHQAGMAVHAVNLTADLQRSRQQLVTTREEERRRLRRDLHDGLGPNLASQGLKLAAVKQLAEKDPASAIPLLEQVMIQNQSTIEEIRRLVYGLRPPALDELGLVAALRDHVAGMDGKSGLQIEIIAPQAGLPALTAAVEVAAYRIVLEALTNVIRHARAQRCGIRFLLDETNSGSFFQIEIQDDGIGLPGTRRAGVGTRSMRERAEELGGTCVIESGEGTGTRVCVNIPLRSA